MHISVGCSCCDVVDDDVAAAAAVDVCVAWHHQEGACNPIWPMIEHVPNVIEPPHMGTLCPKRSDNHLYFSSR